MEGKMEMVRGKLGTGELDRHRACRPAGRGAGGKGAPAGWAWRRKQGPEQTSRRDRLGGPAGVDAAHHS